MRRRTPSNKQLGVCYRIIIAEYEWGLCVCLYKAHIINQNSQRSSIYCTRIMNKWTQIIRIYAYDANVLLMTVYIIAQARGSIWKHARLPFTIRILAQRIEFRIELPSFSLYDWDAFRRARARSQFSSLAAYVFSDLHNEQHISPGDPSSNVPIALHLNRRRRRICSPRHQAVRGLCTSIVYWRVVASACLWPPRASIPFNSNNNIVMTIIVCWLRQRSCGITERQLRALTASTQINKRNSHTQTQTQTYTWCWSWAAAYACARFLRAYVCTLTSCSYRHC